MVWHPPTQARQPKARRERQDLDDGKVKEAELQLPQTTSDRRTDERKTTSKARTIRRNRKVVPQSRTTDWRAGCTASGTSQHVYFKPVRVGTRLGGCNMSNEGVADDESFLGAARLPAFMPRGLSEGNEA